MKRIIEIECPENYKPVYNAETGSIEIVPEDIIGRIMTYEDAKRYLGYGNKVHHNKSIDALFKLQTVLEALNEKHKFNLLIETVWYPWVQFFRMKSMPKDANAEVIGHFRYQGEKFALEGGYAHRGGIAGLGSFDSRFGVGYASSIVGMLACKSEEIARYVSTQFGRLVFDACLARHFEDKEFEWLD